MLNFSDDILLLLFSKYCMFKGYIIGTYNFLFSFVTAATADGGISDKPREETLSVGSILVKQQV